MESRGLMNSYALDRTALDVQRQSWGYFVSFVRLQRLTGSFLRVVGIDVFCMEGSHQLEHMHPFRVYFNHFNEFPQSIR